ncbi:hypothetical protein [Neotabrizicola shimadae]|uniref:Uncharacterized protein n=1 Tax=Neotabrizicola shimadae TaxID=2807096 RepID=A0A8G0ZYZ7_9RHOB|nr:hypothetical protein [Neotabrizicola shimadae]QYZ71646.1 hypothetical protein JO391_09190 [Neotabrizicola shimadae]
MARPVRILLILVLTLALLPWGAWIRAANATPPAHHPAIEVTAPAAPQAAAPAHRCRTATLPGTACPADPALLPAAQPTPDAATTRALRAADVTARSLHAPPGPERPPRLA